MVNVYDYIVRAGGGYDWNEGGKEQENIQWNDENLFLSVPRTKAAEEKVVGVFDAV